MIEFETIETVESYTSKELNKIEINIDKKVYGFCDMQNL